MRWCTRPGRAPVASSGPTRASRTTDLLVFGHSHIPWDSVTPGGLRLLNPGSPTDRRRQPACTYLTCTLAGGRVDAVELHRCRPVEPGRGLPVRPCRRGASYARRVSTPRSLAAAAVHRHGGAGRQRRAPRRPRCPARQQTPRHCGARPRLHRQQGGLPAAARGPDRRRPPGARLRPARTARVERRPRAGRVRRSSALAGDLLAACSTRWRRTGARRRALLRRPGRAAGRDRAARGLPVADPARLGAGGTAGAARGAIEVGRPLLVEGGQAAVWPCPCVDEQPAAGDRGVRRARFHGNSADGLLVMGDALLDEPDRTDALAGTGMPLLVAHGDDDDAWPPELQAAMAQRLGAQHQVIVGRPALAERRAARAGRPGTAGVLGRGRSAREAAEGTRDTLER